MKTKSLDLLILVALLWAGMIAGISFLEAPVKFTAPSLTRSVGLDVGRHVFQAFNKVEIVWATLLCVLAFISRPSLTINLLAGLVIFLLLLECFWLLPVLDERAIAIIAGKEPSGQSPHFLYILFDGLKLSGLVGLALLGFGEHRARAIQGSK